MAKQMHLQLENAEALSAVIVAVNAAGFQVVQPLAETDEQAAQPIKLAAPPPDRDQPANNYSANSHSNRRHSNSSHSNRSHSES